MAKGRIQPGRRAPSRSRSCSSAASSSRTSTLERLVDVALQTKLATDNGIQIAETDIDEQLLEEGTTSEQRHTWMIEIEPDVDPDTGEASTEQKRAALVRAQQALGRLSRGETWEDVAKTASDSASAAQSGDLGWLSKDSGYDEAFMDAIFAAPINEPTSVVEGKDGAYRIGRYTELDPEFVDPDFQLAIADAGITLADYRVAIRGDVLRTKLSEKIVADLSKPGPQRHVLQIRLPEPNTSSVEIEPGTKVRWIAFAPKDDMAGASKLPDDRPRLGRREGRRRPDVQHPQGHPDQVRRARAQRLGRGQRQEQRRQAALVLPVLDDRRGPQERHRQQHRPRRDRPRPDQGPGRLVRHPDHASHRGRRRLARGPQGQGHGRRRRSSSSPATTARARAPRTAATSAGSPAASWSDLLDEAVFATAIGATSDVVEVSGDGSYLVRILAEETRELTEDQLEIVESSGFSYWYTREKEKADIEYTLGTASTG